MNKPNNIKVMTESDGYYLKDIQDSIKNIHDQLERVRTKTRDKTPTDEGEKENNRNIISLCDGIILALSPLISTLNETGFYATGFFAPTNKNYKIDYEQLSRTLASIEDDANQLSKDNPAPVRSHWHSNYQLLTQITYNHKKQDKDFLNKIGWRREKRRRIRMNALGYLTPVLLGLLVAGAIITGGVFAGLAMGPIGIAVIIMGIILGLTSGSIALVKSARHISPRIFERAENISYDKRDFIPKSKGKIQIPYVEATSKALAAIDQHNSSLVAEAAKQKRIDDLAKIASEKKAAELKAVEVQRAFYFDAVGSSGRTLAANVLACRAYGKVDAINSEIANVVTEIKNIQKAINGELDYLKRLKPKFQKNLGLLKAANVNRNVITINENTTIGEFNQLRNNNWFDQDAVKHVIHYLTYRNELAYLEAIKAAVELKEKLLGKELAKYSDQENYIAAKVAVYTQNPDNLPSIDKTLKDYVVGGYNRNLVGQFGSYRDPRFSLPQRTNGPTFIYGNATFILFTPCSKRITTQLSKNITNINALKP